MDKLVKFTLIFSLSVVFLNLSPLIAKDADFDKENLSKEQIVNIIKNSSNLKIKDINKLVKILSEKFGTDHEGKLQGDRMLTAR